MPLYSIITVCRNAAPSLRTTLHKVLAQTFRDLEIVVVDGASTDETPQVLREVEQMCRVEGVPFLSVSEPDRGIYDAMNKGVKMAHGEWVCFMNAGDAFHSERVLEEVLPYAHQPADVIYGSVCQIMQFGRIEISPRPLATLRRKMAFCHQSAFVRREHLLAHPFDLAFSLVADYEFFYWAQQQGLRFQRIPVTVADFESEEGASSKNRLRMSREFARINGRDKTWKWWAEYAAKSLEVGGNRLWRALVPKKTVAALRRRNYQRIQRQNAAPQLIMTLLVKNEEKVIEENLRFHRAMGVDGFIVTDNNSTDSTPQILQRYKEKGWILELIHEPAEGYEQQQWVHRMILLAKKKYHARWVINADADEFWYAASGSLREALLQARGNVVRCPLHIVYPDEGKPWTQWEECIRPVPKELMESFGMGPFNMFGESPCKVAHRTKGYWRISMGNHKVRMLWPRRSKVDIVVYHYVYRGRKHFTEKVINGGQQLEKHKSKHGGRHWRYFYALYKQGRLDEAYDAVAAVGHVEELRAQGFLLPLCPVPKILSLQPPEGGRQGRCCTEPSLTASEGGSPVQNRLRRHAFLIMAHSEPRLLRTLLAQLDDERNDIFLHIDRKATEMQQAFQHLTLQRARLFVLPQPLAVYWGHVSQMEVELLLMRAALAEGEYAYYHLLSGSDLLLKTQDEFHAFFAAHQGKEFVGFWNDARSLAEVKRRVRYFYPFVRYRRKHTYGWKHAVCMPLMNISLALQKAVGYDRCKHRGEPAKGYNWFSITHDLCTYVVAQAENLKKQYNHTLCPDEIFLHTLLKNSPYAQNIYDASDATRSSQRMIDWERGNPYVWQLKDVPALLQSPWLIARKFSEAHFDAVEALVAEVQNRS